MDSRTILSAATFQARALLLGARLDLRVEWYIVILIVVEILITVYAMWRP